MDAKTNIVVVVNRSTDADNVLHKAAAMAKSSPNGARVHVVRVIFEDLADHAQLDDTQTQALKLYLMQAEEEFLVDLVEDHRAHFDDIETATLWNKRVSDAVEKAAETFNADLIIKSADPESPHFPRHPDDWNLLRHATCPVFLVKPESWHDNPGILTCVNVTDIEHQAMNERIIDAGAKLAQSLDGQLHIVNALPPTNPLLVSAEIGVDFKQLEYDVDQEIRTQLRRLLAKLQLSDAQLHVHAGKPAQVVKDVAEDINAAAVVAGTAGRQGVTAMVIGNTSETLLHTLHQDLLVLHV